MAVISQRELAKQVETRERAIFDAACKIASGDNDNESESKAKLSVPAPTVDPFDFDIAGGLLGELAMWIYETSRSPIKEFATMSAVATLAAFFGRAYVGPTGSGLNFYLVMTAGAGYGKNRPLNAPEQIAVAVGRPQVIGPNNVTGDSAIERALRRSPVLVLPWDEFGLVLQDATGRSATSWNVTIRRALLELYSKSETGMTWRAKLHAASHGDKDEEPIPQPTLTILGATTPEAFYAGLTAASGPQGLLNRLVVISVENRPVKQEVVPQPKPPAALVSALREAIVSSPLKTNLASTSAGDSIKSRFRKS